MLNYQEILNTLNSCSSLSVQQSLYYLIDKIYIKGLERQSEKGIGYKMLLQIIFRSPKHYAISKKCILHLKNYFSTSEQGYKHFYWILSQMFEFKSNFIQIWKQLFKKRSSHFESKKLVENLNQLIELYPDQKLDLGPTIFLWFLKKTINKKKYQNVFIKLKKLTNFSERYFIKFLEKLEKYTNEILHELTSVINSMILENPDFIEVWKRVHLQHFLSSMILFHSNQEFLFKYQKELEPIREKFFPKPKEQKKNDSKIIVMAFASLAFSVIALKAIKIISDYFRG